MKRINLTVIADRSCSTARTYLEYLRIAGLMPQHLWLVDFGQRSLRKRLFMSRFAPAPYLNESKVYHNLCMNIQCEAGLAPIDYFMPWDGEGYAEKVTRFYATDFNDANLQARMKHYTNTAFLYTNGGIVPATILDEKDVRVLHIHPGIVPELRGSDCLLWSVKLRNKIGMSCFYMNAGIDEGDLIAQHEWEIPKLPSLAETLNPRDEDIAYRALLYALDPHYRAQLLVKVIGAAEDMRSMKSTPQPKAARPAYLWMHPRLRLKCMRETFL